MRQAAKARVRNMSTKRNLKAATKAFTAKNSLENLSKAQSQIDKAVKKNLLPKNTAARKKAQLAATAKATGTQTVSKVKKDAPKKTVAKKTTVKKTVAKAKK